MYQINDLVIYNNDGVCKVMDICTLKMEGIDRNKLYYVFEPVFSSGKIYAPVDTTVFLRLIMTCEKVQKLIDGIPYIQTEFYEVNTPVLPEDYYKALIQSHNCHDLIKLIKTLYMRKQNLLSQGKKFGQADENYLSRAEDLLYSEFAIVLNIQKDHVKDYIEEKVNKTENCNHDTQ